MIYGNDVDHGRCQFFEFPFSILIQLISRNQLRTHDLNDLIKFGRSSVAGHLDTQLIIVNDSKHIDNNSNRF